MFTAQDRSLRLTRGERSRAFTLLEIMLAVAILGMMATAIYRFVATNVTAVRLTAELSQDDAQYQTFTNLLTEQLQDLPAGQGKLWGDPFKFSGKSRDEINWVCSAGPGLLTRYATGDYNVTLRLRPMKGNDRFVLGMVREPASDTSPMQENQSWIPLIDNLTEMEIRYFDPRLNTWVDKWTDRGTLPHLIRFSLLRANSTVAWSTVIALRRTPL